MVAGDAGAGVVGVEDRVLHELAYVGTFQAIEDLVPLRTSTHQARQPQLGQVLGYAGGRSADCCGQLTDRQLVVQQCPQQPDPGVVGKHLEDLHGQRDLVLTQVPRCYPRICVHTQTVTRLTYPAHLKSRLVRPYGWTCQACNSASAKLVDAAVLPERTGKCYAAEILQLIDA